MKTCKAIMEFGDDFGDNSCTFHCQLEEGHPGKHREEGAMYDKHPYCLEWEADMSALWDDLEAEAEKPDELG